MTSIKDASPIAASERFVSLDFLRGFAILGILVMNIQAFTMIGAAYMNPTISGDFTGLNQIIYYITHIFADQKFMSIFSILFGAGIVLFTDRAVAKGVSPGRLHYRRTFWLLLIGLVHAYLFWYGDILVPYAFCAFIVYLFRKLKPKTLLITGTLIFSVSSIIYILFGLSVPYWPPEALEGAMTGWAPSESVIADEVAAYTGSWSDQMGHRAVTSFFFETYVFLIWSAWRAGGLMMAGMALYKLGILTAEKSHGFYVKGFMISVLAGLPLVIFGVVQNYQNNYSMEYSMFLGSQFNYWGSAGLAFAYICLIMLIYKSASNGRLVEKLSGVGRTALSNYLFQTLICTLVFYGHGLGLFGKVNRWQQLLFVLGVWVVQLILTDVWLKYYRIGPAEWVWRSLTYKSLQPIKKMN